MGKEFLKVDILGTLNISEVFFFYEEPQIFTCTSRFGQVYLCLLTDMDDKRWLLAPISLSRLALLKSNRVSMKEAFIDAEDEFVWSISQDSMGYPIKANQVYCKDISCDDLPDEDVYLDYTEDSLMPIKDDEIFKIANEEKRDILDISFLPCNSHTREIDCATLGETLINTQQVIYSLALSKEHVGSKIPSKVKKENTIVATGTYAASFGVRFKSAELADIYGKTSLSETMTLLAELLSTKNSETNLKILLKEHSSRTVVQYKKLLGGLLKAELAVNISLASPNNYSFKTEFTKDDILKNVNFLETEIEDMVISEKMYGTVVGINVDKKTFAFKSREEENIIGTLADNFNDVTFEVPQYIEATFDKKISSNTLTRHEKWEYKLVSLKEIVVHA